MPHLARLGPRPAVLARTALTALLLTIALGTLAPLPVRALTRYVTTTNDSGPETHRDVIANASLGDTITTAGKGEDAPPTDQRGTPRPHGVAVDLGAVEARPPKATTTDLAYLPDGRVRLEGTVYPGDLTTSVFFQWGPTTSYGWTVDAEPSTVMGTTDTPVSAVVSMDGLLPNTVYYFRLVAQNAEGLSYGGQMGFGTPCAESTVVTSTALTGEGSLDQALWGACWGGTVTFDPSLTGQTIALDDTLGLYRSVTIDASALSQPVTLDGGGEHRVLLVLSGINVTLKGLALAHGTAELGGGVQNQGTLVMEDCTVRASIATQGAGVYSLDTLVARRCTFRDNEAWWVGGGVTAIGAVTLEDCTFTENTAPFYAGLDYTGVTGITSTLRGCAFIDNHATEDYGALGLSGGTMEATNCTFSGNTGGGGMGGVVLCNDATLRLSHATFAGCPAGPGQGKAIYVMDGTLYLANSIIACPNDPGCQAVYGAEPPQVEGTNIVQDGSVAGALAVDPLLAPLGDHGGPTRTHALLPGSPALNAGVALPGVTTDQRGVARPQGSAPDVGAYEERVPGVTTGAATDVTKTSATLHGTVNAHGKNVTARFLLGETASYGVLAAVPGTLTGDAAQSVSVTLPADLTPGTTYHYRLVAESLAGVTFGEDRTFTTQALPTPTPPPTTPPPPTPPTPPPGYAIYLPLSRR